MGEEADADWQAGLVEWGLVDATRPATGCRHQWSDWKIIGHTGDWFHPHIVERFCKKCGGKETDDQ